MDDLSALAQAMRWEADDTPASGPGTSACGAGSLKARNGRQTSVTDARGRELPIYQAAGPGGRTFPLLKAMLTTSCERDCLYCPFRAGHDMRRATFRPEEMARAFDGLHRAGTVQGLFLSTGILRGGANTQNGLLETAEILRRRYDYHGYLHLKIMPGAERGQVERAMQLADRVSVNLEAPNATRLERLAPRKDFESELLTPLRWIEAIRRDGPNARARRPTSATQFVVGAAGESDFELLATTENLYRHLGLQRVYFSAFDPLPGTPLEALPAETPLRELRLYQASFLLRDYGFNVEEFPFDDGGRLPLDRDPKRAYANRALSDAPVDINCAAPEELRRVPGIGRRAAEKIVSARRTRSLSELGQLQALGILAARAAPYIVLGGRRPPIQGTMFSAQISSSVA